MDQGTVPPHVRAAAGKLRLLLKALSVALLLAFGWLKLRGIPFLSVVRSVDARAVLQFAIGLYFVSWVAGSTFDIDLREDTYVDPPTAASFRWLFPLFVSLAVVFGVLCWVSTSRQFAAVLLLFWFINAAGWYWAKRWVLPPLFAQARVQPGTVPPTAGRSYLTEAVLTIVERYETGGWQAWRFAIGGALILAINVATSAGVLPAIPRDVSWVSAEVAFAASILCVIILVEGAMWIGRFWVYIAVHVVRLLDKGYVIVPREQWGLHAAVEGGQHDVS